MTQDEFDIVKNIVIANFNVSKTYDYMKDWRGYNPKTYDDIMRIIGECFRSGSSLNFGVGIGWVSTAGFLVGFIGEYLVISWSDNDVCYRGTKTNPLSIEHIKKHSDVCSILNYKGFLRMYKIHKLWTKKDKVTTTTTDNII